MKKYSVYSLLALGVVALSGCQDEEIVKPVNPAVTGEEITFGSSLYDAETRTEYGMDPVNGAYPVYWEEGDKISIYCPQSNNTQRVIYSVTPQDPAKEYEGSEGVLAPGDRSKSESVTKDDKNKPGLQWGAEEVHEFSAFYPANKIINSEQGVITAEIPVEQAPVEWKTTPNGTGTTYTGIANTDYAFMWAFNKHEKSKGGDVALKFRPWVTILDVEINGPADDREVKMSSVQLRSLSGETLTGRFTVDFKAVEENPNFYPTYAAVDDQGGAVRNQITIQLYDKSLNNNQGDFITLRKGDKIVVRFYLLPKDVNYDTSGEGRNDLEIRVAPFNSAVLTRTLNAQNGTVHGGILAHKVNKVILPPVSNAGPNDWMSSLDPNIYVTELSLPGSKMSYQTSDNRASVAYQNLTIADQMDNGIRAFQIQTASINTHSVGWGDLFADASDQHLRACVAGERQNNIPFSDIVKDIADGLKRAEGRGHNNEYAFILLTASLGACDSYDPSASLNDIVSGKEAWMDAIKTDLAAMAGEPDTYRLYTEEITPETTIDDVKGHIIIKVNYNDDEMANRLSNNDRVPAMFAQWGLREDVEDFPETSAYAVNAMRWGTSYDATAGSLKWFYHEATPVGFNNDTGGDYGESSDVKIANIEDMWEKSITYYDSNDSHDMWFLNDLGGSYVNGDIYSSGETQKGVDDWTAYIGPYATRLLQNRNADATLGIVLMNYADPSNEYSGNLIQTIINNNFNFQLRKRDDTSSQQFNATYTNGGNAIGWD